MADWQVRHVTRGTDNAAKLARAKEVYRDAEGWRDTLPRRILADDLAGMLPEAKPATGGKRTNRKRRRKLAQTSKRANRR